MKLQKFLPKFAVSHFFKKVFIEFATILLLFYILGFWPRGMWDITPQPGIEPTPPALEGKVSTTGLPGKSFIYFYRGNYIAII